MNTNTGHQLQEPACDKNNIMQDDLSVIDRGISFALQHDQDKLIDWINTSKHHQMPPNGRNLTVKARKFKEQAGQPDIEKESLLDYLNDPELKNYATYLYSMHVTYSDLVALDNSLNDYQEEETVALVIPEEPLPLISEKEKAPHYPIQALGPVLGDAALSLSECVQVPPAIAGQSILAAASLAVQDHANVLIDGRTYPTSLFCLTIAGSGDRKSAADTLALKAHNEHQKELSELYKVEKLQYDNAFSGYEAASKKIKSEKGATQESIASKLDNLTEPEKPKSPTLLNQEPTLEGLQKSFEFGIPSQGLFSDEGGQFFGGHAMSADNALKSMAGLSKFWDGSSITRTRAAAGESLILYDKRLATHLMVQPIVANKVLGDPLLQKQGFLPRFLIAWPDSITGTREYNHKDATQEQALKLYWKVMGERLNTQHSEERRNITLEPDAKDFWVKAYNGIERSLSKGQPLHEIKETASKAAENIARIAGVLALIDDVNSHAVELNQMKQAVEIGSYYIKEALRLSGSCEGDAGIDDANKLLDWLKKQNAEMVTIRKISQLGPASSRSKAKAKRQISLLVDHGWLNPIPDGAEIDGRHVKEAWRLNNV